MDDDTEGRAQPQAFFEGYVISWTCLLSFLHPVLPAEQHASSHRTAPWSPYKGTSDSGLQSWSRENRAFLQSCACSDSVSRQGVTNPACVV